MLRIGYGEDTHALVSGRKLILGGAEFDFRLGLLGHSDADVLTHSIIDALLGAAALGDIGRLFPDTDSAYKGISSLKLLRAVAARLRDAGFEPTNVDSTIIAQEPKLAPRIDEMRQNIADALSVDISLVSVKATTPEHMGAEGNLECITSRSVAMVNSSV